MASFNGSSFLDLISSPRYNQQFYHDNLRYMVTGNNEFIKVAVEMANFERNTISISFLNNNLNVKGIKRSVIEDNITVYKDTVVWGQFNVNIELPVCVTTDENVSVNYENGILTIIITIVSEQERVTINL